MRIAFYAPLKSPTHGTPSGDRRIAGLLMHALACAGHRVELASTFRSYDSAGDAPRQGALREQGMALGRRLAAQWLGAAPEVRPDLWFTYHAYYKAPDWLGPEASAALGIPYVIAEASHAAKRAGGGWDIGHRGAMQSIGRADLLLCPTRDDLAGVRAAAASVERVVLLPPFLDAAPFRAAAARRHACRSALAQAHGIEPSVPWLAVVAMMRPGDKLASYRALARALSHVRDLPWRLVIAGDGPAREQVEAALAEAVPGRTSFLGALTQEEVAGACAAADLCVWPAVNEAYGMAMLEAQAAGLAVVSCASRGVPDVVEHGRTGLLAPPGDDEAFGRLIRELLLDPARRAKLSGEAAAFAAGERSIEQAAIALGRHLARFARATARTQV
ncbi:MAG: glycosyltransferase family 4 protein [Candidatus Parcubacteria bacterium]|nr:glycosyltransferase family 4 protein [Burkholderiales bacterium]